MFKFHIGQIVNVGSSGESGEVTGRAEYAHSEPSYYVRYTAGDGCTREAWWGESALS